MCTNSYLWKCAVNTGDYSCLLNTTRTWSTSLSSETNGTVSRLTYVSGNTGIIIVSLEQDIFLWKYWNNKCVSGTTGTISVSLELLEQYKCVSGTTGTISVFLELLEQYVCLWNCWNDVCFWNYWNNKRASGTTGTIGVSLD